MYTHTHTHTYYVDNMCIYMWIPCAEGDRRSSKPEKPHAEDVQDEIAVEPLYPVARDENDERSREG